jgi:hypothetical protein
MNGYAVGRQNGWMSANDIRELENLDRIPEEEGGDLYLINGNMTKLKDAGIFAASAQSQKPEEEENRKHEEPDAARCEDPGKEQSPMTRKFWNWVRNETPDSFGSERTLYLNGEISDETWFGDEVTPKLFKDELASGEGNITLWINSPGGDVFAAASDLQHADGLPI